MTQVQLKTANELQGIITAATKFMIDLEKIRWNNKQPTFLRNGDNYAIIPKNLEDKIITLLRENCESTLKEAELKFKNL